MATTKQIKEKIRDYRRSFRHNWDLFKQNRVGLFGLGVMMTFVLIAVLSPFMGLRHPIEWMAPDSDVVIVEKFLDSDINGIVETAFVQRIRPTGGNEQSVDRIYFAGGNGTDITKQEIPYGLYAKRATDGGKAWTIGTFSGAYETQSPITSQPVGVNFGSKSNPDLIDFWVFFGCEDGTLYALRDELRAQNAPSGSNVISFSLDGAVTGVDVYEDDVSVMNEDDTFFACTAAGSLYAYDGNFNLKWTKTGNDRVTNTSLTKPVVTGDGNSVYVSSRDGKLYGFNAENGLQIDVYDLYDPAYDYAEEEPNANEKAAANERRGYLSSEPVAVGNTIFTGTDDGRVHIIHAENATALPGWEGGYKVENSGLLDLGNLTTPDVRSDGQELFISSSTGFFYRIGTGARDSTTTSVRLVFDTTLQGTILSSCVASPTYDWQYSKYLFVPATNLNGTPDNPSDDYSVIYCVDTFGNVTWRKTVDGVMKGAVIFYDDYASGSDTQHTGQGEICFATVMQDSDGLSIAGRNARLYSFNSRGRMIAPLPPTWFMSQEFKDENWPDDEQQPPSGYSYALGTDAQGRDILSQTLLGSRIALLVGFAAAFFSISVGLLVGLVSGYYGGTVDSILMRFTDVILVLPGLPLLIILAALMQPSVWNIVFIIGIVGWGGTARIIRSEVLTLKERPFIDSARVSGASKTRIMFRHIAPNILPLAVLYMTFIVSGAILSEAALSFIGLGDPRTMSWGMMLNFVQHANALTAWWWLVPPGLCITFVCLSFFLLGRAFDEIVNPRLRRRQ